MSGEEGAGGPRSAHVFRFHLRSQGGKKLVVVGSLNKSSLPSKFWGVTHCINVKKKAASSRKVGRKNRVSNVTPHEVPIGYFSTGVSRTGGGKKDVQRSVSWAGNQERGRGGINAASTDSFWETKENEKCTDVTNYSKEKYEKGDSAWRSGKGNEAVKAAATGEFPKGQVWKTKAKNECLRVQGTAYYENASPSAKPKGVTGKERFNSLTRNEVIDGK